MPRLIDNSKITQGKTTIPKAVRNLYKLSDGDTIDWKENGEKQVIVEKCVKKPSKKQ